VLFWRQRSPQEAAKRDAPGGCYRRASPPNVQR
jgi:hypothetical protein